MGFFNTLKNFAKGLYTNITNPSANRTFKSAQASARKKRDEDEERQRQQQQTRIRVQQLGSPKVQGPLQVPGKLPKTVEIKSYSNTPTFQAPRIQVRPTQAKPKAPTIGQRLEGGLKATSKAPGEFASKLGKVGYALGKGLLYDAPKAVFNDLPKAIVTSQSNRANLQTEGRTVRDRLKQADDIKKQFVKAGVKNKELDEYIKGLNSAKKQIGKGTENLRLRNVVGSIGKGLGSEIVESVKDLNPIQGDKRALDRAKALGLNPKDANEARVLLPALFAVGLINPGGKASTAGKALSKIDDVTRVIPVLDDVVKETGITLGKKEFKILAEKVATTKAPKEVDDLIRKAVAVEAKKPRIKLPEIEGSLTLRDYGIVKMKNKKDFNFAIQKVSKDSGLSLDDARIKVGELLNNEREISVRGVAEVPRARLQIQGKVTKDPVVKDLLKTLSQNRIAANTEESLTSAALKTEAKKLGVNLDQGFIDRYQAGRLGSPQEIEMGRILKETTDQVFMQQRILDSRTPYRKNYVPQVYEQGEEAAVEASRRLQLTTGSTQPRKFNTYAEAAEFNLTPKFPTANELIGSNAGEAKRAIGNREVVEQGLRQGLFDNNPKKGWTPIEGFFNTDGTQIYAQKAVADTLNGVLQENTTGLGRILKGGARINQVWQNIALAGGIPYTPLNFFTLGQTMKELAAGRISVAKDLAYSLTPALTQKRFADAASFVKKMSERGVPFGIPKGDFKLLSWGDAVDKPTFERFLPNEYLTVAENTYSKLKAKGLSESKALNIAAETTKNYYGITNQILSGRSKLTQNAIGTVFFAPKYRESIINTLMNTGKSLAPQNWGDKSYTMNRRLAAGIAVTAVAYDALNYKINGHHMWDNRDGQELSLEIPYGEKDEKGNQPVINIPFMPGFMTLPRAAYGAIKSAVEGDLQGVASEGSKTLSQPLKVAGEVIGNKDYFGRPIRVDNKVAAEQGVDADTPLKQALNTGVYLGKSALPSPGRGIVDVAQGKPIEQGIAQGLELPVRFGKRINKNTKVYFEELEKTEARLDPNRKAKFDAIFQKKQNAIGQDIKETNPNDRLTKFNVLKGDPKLFEEVARMNRALKKRTGQPIDPIYDKKYKDIAKDVLWVRSLAPGESSDTKQKLLYSKKEYDSFQNDERKYYKNLEKKLGKRDDPYNYPQPSEKVQKLEKSYYGLPENDGPKGGNKARREFIENNDDLVAYWEKRREAQNRHRKALGLPPLEDPLKDFANSKSSVKSRTGRKGAKSKGGSSGRGSGTKSGKNNYTGLIPLVKSYITEGSLNAPRPKLAKARNTTARIPIPKGTPKATRVTFGASNNKPTFGRPVRYRRRG